MLNNLNRGLGLSDGYPFVLSAPAIDKMRFVHGTIASAAAESRRAGTPTAPPVPLDSANAAQEDEGETAPR